MLMRTRLARNDFSSVLPSGIYNSNYYYDNLAANESSFLAWSKTMLTNYSMYCQAYVTNPGWSFNQTFGSTNRGLGKFNDCVNNKTQLVSIPFSARYMGKSFKCVVGCHRARLNTEGYNLITSNRNYFNPKPLPTYDSLVQIARMRATCNLVPAFEPYIETLNFLFELKDFRDITKETSRFFGNHKKQITDTLTEIGRRRAAPGPKGIPVAEPTGAIAGGWLFNQFAVQPFLRDMADIVSGLSEVATEAYSKFKQKGLEPSTMHYSEVVQRDTFTEGLYGEYPMDGYAVYSVFDEVIFTATLQQTYTAPEQTNLQIQEAAWGLRLTPSVIWNATKFTFLLDYFVRIGKALEAAHRYKNRIDAIPLQYCESLLTRRVNGFVVRGENITQMDYGLKGKNKIPNRAPLTAVIDSRYRRSLVSPALCMPLPKFHIPSGTQGLNMLALARVFL